MEYVSYYDYRKKDELFVSKNEQRIVFFLVAFGITALTYGFFALIDFLPESPAQTGAVALTESTNNKPVTEESQGASTTENIHISRYPIRIIFDALDKSVPIENPESDDVATLDSALLKGAVRHPDSGDFERKGTIFILAHSSYLPNVINKNFQAFNGIQKLKWGDTIRLQSEDREYLYRVDRVYRAVASDTEVAIEAGKERLTLATCNSFGTKDDRFMVDATLVDSYPIST